MICIIMSSLNMVKIMSIPTLHSIKKIPPKGKNTLSPPKICNHKYNTFRINFLLMSKHHILDFFGLFQIYLIIFTNVFNFF